MALSPVLSLRRMIDEPDTAVYSDAELQARLDGSPTIYSAARDLWAEKLSAAAGLVNISEGGSSRSMSQQFDHYKEMYALYQGLANDAGDGNNPTGPVIRRIARV